MAANASAGSERVLAGQEGSPRRAIHDGHELESDRARRQKIRRESASVLAVVVPAADDRRTDGDLGQCSSEARRSRSGARQTCAWRLARARCGGSDANTVVVPEIPAGFARRILGCEAWLCRHSMRLV